MSFFSGGLEDKGLWWFGKNAEFGDVCERRFEYDGYEDPCDLLCGGWGIIVGFGFDDGVFVSVAKEKGEWRRIYAGELVAEGEGVWGWHQSEDGRWRRAGNAGDVVAVWKVDVEGAVEIRERELLRGDKWSEL